MALRVQLKLQQLVGKPAGRPLRAPIHFCVLSLSWQVWTGAPLHSTSVSSMR